MNKLMNRYKSPIIKDSILYRGDNGEREYYINDIFTFSNIKRNFRAFSRIEYIARGFLDEEPENRTYPCELHEEKKKVVFVLSTNDCEGISLDHATRYCTEEEVLVYTDNVEFKVFKVEEKNDIDYVYIRRRIV